MNRRTLLHALLLVPMATGLASICLLNTEAYALAELNAWRRALHEGA
jgi:hypothetical protein